MDIIKDTFPSPQPQTEYSLQPVFAKIPFFGMIDLRFRSFLIPLPFQNHTTPLLPPLIFNHLIQPRRLITTLYPSLPSASPSPSFLSSPLPPPPLLLPPLPQPPARILITNSLSVNSKQRELLHFQEEGGREKAEEVEEKVRVKRWRRENGEKEN